MRFLKLFVLTLLMIIVAQGKTFAATPEISASDIHFDILKGSWVLKGNVHVGIDNHGFKATVTADEALVSVVKQKCWADGHVKLLHGDIFFSCDRAYMQWSTKTASVVGSVRFENKQSVVINSDTAVFDWDNKIVDFYGNITIKTGQELQFAQGVNLDGKNYQHIKYNVVDDTILALDKNFDIPAVTIPSTDD